MIAEIDDLEAEIRAKIAVKGKEFSEAGIVSKEKAERRIDDLTEEVEYLSRKLLNSFDGIIHKAQEKTKSELNNIYRRYVDSFLKNGATAYYIKWIKNVVGNINLTLQDEEIGEVQVAVGKRKVGERSIATWYNPFSWGKPELLWKQYMKPVNRSIFARCGVERKDVYTKFQLTSTNLLE
ncbi:hypothetical protein INT80_12660 [Gallibacterium anatis]|uniref:Uncharacterized protein n=1 Tax=Gallibacterium anatis TaxID=750 RepID=A0A930Y5G9_9PAST|nr:hypothetical protein [Gallibacterium anatis]